MSALGQHLCWFFQNLQLSLWVYVFHSGRYFLSQSRHRDLSLICSSAKVLQNYFISSPLSLGFCLIGMLNSFQAYSRETGPHWVICSKFNLALLVTLLVCCVFDLFLLFLSSVPVQVIACVTVPEMAWNVSSGILVVLLTGLTLITVKSVLCVKRRTKLLCMFLVDAVQPWSVDIAF